MNVTAIPFKTTIWHCPQRAELDSRNRCWREIIQVPCTYLLVPVVDESLDLGHVNTSVFPWRKGNRVNQEECSENRWGFCLHKIEKPLCALRGEEVTMKGRVWSSDMAAVAGDISWAEFRGSSWLPGNESARIDLGCLAHSMSKDAKNNGPLVERVGKRANWVQSSHTW